MVRRRWWKVPSSKLPFRRADVEDAARAEPRFLKRRVCVMDYRPRCHRGSRAGTICCPKRHCAESSGRLQGLPPRGTIDSV
jgi:hypothetical protein